MSQPIAPLIRDRRALGAHYSPQAVVAQVVERTLGVALRQKRFSPEDPPRVCDPACGDGVFLESAAARLERWMSRRAPQRSATWIRERVGEAIHGVDLDPEAAAHAAQQLCQRDITSPRVAVGNSLLHPGRAPAAWQPVDFTAAFPDSRPGGRFDVVVGNPPFVDAEEMTRNAPELRRHLAGAYETARGNWDLYCVFVERAVSLLAEGGYLGLILPNKLLSASYAARTRELLSALELRLVRDFSRVRLFEAAVYPLVLVARWRGGPPGAASGASRAARSAPSAPSASSASSAPSAPSARTGASATGSAASRGCAFERARGTLESCRVEPVGRVPASRLRETAAAGWARFLSARQQAGAAVIRSGTPRVPLRPLGQLVPVCGAATVNEAYRLAPLLVDAADVSEALAASEDDRAANETERPAPGPLVPRGQLGLPGMETARRAEHPAGRNGPETLPDFPEIPVPVVNTGTLDPHRIRWGERPMRYLGCSYRHPRASLAALAREMPARARQAVAPKVVVAGMTRRLECVFDPGRVLAAKSTSLLHVEPGSAGEALGWWLAGLLNSAAASRRYRRQFEGLALASGYLRVGPPQLRALEIPDPACLEPAARQIVQDAARRLAALAAAGVPEDDAAWLAASADIDRRCAAWYGEGEAPK
jgi:methylase of polypeptide subunit release factors